MTFGIPMDNTQIPDPMDVAKGSCTVEELKQRVSTGSAIILSGVRNKVAVGRDLLLKVNTSIGVSSHSGLKTELRKLELLSTVPYKPDALMDLSIVKTSCPLHVEMINQFGGPVGTLPHYTCYEPGIGIDAQRLLDTIEAQAEGGIAFMTMHLTPTRELFEKAEKTRAVPCTSRGGGLVIADMYLNDRREGVFAICFDEILKILKRYDVVLSIGAAFRPASIVDALDQVHKAELALQREFIKRAHEFGVQVMIEGVGHIDLRRIAQYVALIHETCDVPVMPLGPLPTDAAGGEDHIAASIGASYMAMLGGAHMINSITRDEHRGDIPSVESVLEGLRAAKVTAHCVNVARFGSEIDNEIYHDRSRYHTCVVGDGLFAQRTNQEYHSACSRCGDKCPLVFDRTKIITRS